jgi:hypothetical protein
MYSSPNIIQIIKSRRMRLARHVACMGRREVQRVVVVNLKEGDHLEDPGIEGG